MITKRQPAWAPADLRGYAGMAGARAEGLAKLASLPPDNPTIYLSRGDVLYREGAKDEAHPHWQKALQLAAPADAGLRGAFAERLSGHVTDETFK